MCKRNCLTALAVLAVLTANNPDCDAQNLLRGLKQKAEQAISNKIGGSLLGGDKQETSEDAQQSAPDQTATVEESQPAVPTANDRVPKMRQSTVVWDGEIAPSTAPDAKALLKELPPLPSPAEIADPADGYRESYHRILTSIYLRAQELDAKSVCSQDELDAQRDKVYKELEAQTGLTTEEIKMMEDPEVPVEEKEKLQKRAASKMFGTDIDALQSQASASGERREKIEAELEPLEKKVEKGEKLTAAEQKRYDELQQEQAQMAMEMMSMMGGLMGQMEKVQQNNSYASKSLLMEKKLSDYSAKVAKLRLQEASVAKSCEQIAKDYEQDLKDIYAQVWTEVDAAKVHSLYDKADDLVKNYRLRAAEVHLKSLAVRLANVKALLPEAESLFEELVEAGIVPGCVSGRPALNLVVDCVDILQEAYADFPQPDFINCCSQSAVKFPLQSGDRIFAAESGYSGSLAVSGIGGEVAPEETLERDFVSGSKLLVYNEADKSYYKLEDGARAKLSGDGPFDFAVSQKRAETAYGSILLRDGKRKALYGKDGALTLHDGSVFYPLAMQRLEDRLVFIVPGASWGSFVKCTYKL